MYGTSSIDWNDENISTLKKMWGSGHSATQIAAEIPYASRSAVLGKVSRLKLAPRRETNARAATQAVDKINPGWERGRPRAPAPAAIPRKEKPSRIASSIFGNFTHAKPDPEPIPDTDPSDGRGIGLLELRNHTCRWPKGNPAHADFLYCGDPSANLKDGRPYCPFHTLKSVDRNGIRNKHAFQKSAEYAAR